MLNGYYPPFPAAYVGDYSETWNPSIGEWGVDIPLVSGTQIHAPFDGVFGFENSHDANWGLRVWVRAPSGETQLYGHCKQMFCTAGQNVKAGDIISLSGGGLNDADHGHTTGPHIEFQYQPHGGDVYVLANFVDPRWYIGYIYGNPTPTDEDMTLDNVRNHVMTAYYAIGADPFPKGETPDQYAQRIGNAIDKHCQDIMSGVRDISSACNDIRSTHPHP